jgi:hypothetical protein
MSLLRSFVARIALLLAVGVAAFGCLHHEARESLREPRAASPQKSQAVATAADDATTVDYLEGTHAAEALAMIRKAAGEEFRTLDIEINPAYVTATVQDRADKSKIFEYEVKNGALIGPAPVRFNNPDTSAAAISGQAFDPAVVAMDRIGDIVREARSRLRVGERAEALVGIRKWDPDGRIEIRVVCPGLLSGGTYVTDARGQHGKASAD